MRCLIILMLFFTSYLALADVYKKVDENNRTSYSDKHTKGAKKIKLPLVQHYSPVTVAPIDDVYVDKDKPKRYNTISMTQPQPEATVRNNHGLVRVDVITAPELREEDRFIIFLDGKQEGNPQISHSFTLTGIDRGTHTVMVKVLDPNGHVVAQTDEVVFHLHRPRENMPSGPYPFPFVPSPPPVPAPGP